MSAGRRSIMAFQMERASSYPASSDRISSPRRLSLNFRIVSSCRMISPFVRVLTCRLDMPTSFPNEKCIGVPL